MSFGPINFNNDWRRSPRALLKSELVVNEMELELNTVFSSKREIWNQKLMRVNSCSCNPPAHARALSVLLDIVLLILFNLRQNPRAMRVLSWLDFDCVSSRHKSRRLILCVCDEQVEWYCDSQINLPEKIREKPLWIGGSSPSGCFFYSSWTEVSKMSSTPPSERTPRCCLAACIV